jgi:mannose-1-phosphate guanylyltransferase
LLPDIYGVLSSVSIERMDEVYANARRETIDVGIMERAPNVATIPADFAWSDIGSWAELWELSERDPDGNVCRLLADSQRNLVFAKGRTVALVGVEDLVVIETADAVFVCPRERAQDVKLIVQRLQREGDAGLL